MYQVFFLEMKGFPFYEIFLKSPSFHPVGTDICSDRFQPNPFKKLEKLGTELK